MAGIWERVKSTATDRLSSHLLDAAMVFRGDGTFTAQQILDVLNAHVSNPLEGAELTDLSAIVTVLSGTSGAANKLVYKEKVKAALLCAEMGAINEATFRSVLGIA